MTDEFVRKLGKEVSEDFSDIDKQAKESMSIFISGSYKDSDDKQALLDFKAICHKEGFTGSFLMEEIPVQEYYENHLDKKFTLIWDKIKSKNPCFILYAGKSAVESQGFLAELTEISKNQNMLNVSYLYKIKEIELPHHEKNFTNLREVESSEEFLKFAIDTIKRKANQIKTFIIHEREKD